MTLSNPKKCGLILLMLVTGLILLGYMPISEGQEEAFNLPTNHDEAAEEAEFTPGRVSMSFSDVPLNQILTTIAQSTDLNIIGGEALSQKVSVRLKDVLLADVFDIILKSSGYTYIKDGEVLRIVSEDELPLVTEVFELKFANASQIEEAASHLVSGQGNLKTFSKFSEEEYSNCLIITDTPTSVEAVRSLVGKLDRRVEQVMIEVKFCEVTLDKDIELGIEWAIAASLRGAGTETMFPIHKMGLERLERPAEFSEPEGEITLGTVSFTEFTTTLHALDSESEVNLIATPRIATRDGEEAEIVIGDKVPIPLYERNESTGTMEVTGYQTEEVGVLLRVTPIVNRDNTVTLKIYPEVSEITGYTGPNDERPIVSTRQVNTVFTVEDGKTVVIGGLMNQTLSKSVERVPFFGKIPVLGRLFSYQDDSTDRTELLIFITPHITESPERMRQQAEAVIERLNNELKK